MFLKCGLHLGGGSKLSRILGGVEWGGHVFLEESGRDAEGGQLRWVPRVNVNTTNLIPSG